MPASERLGKLQWMNHLMAHRPQHPKWTPATFAVLSALHSYADQHGEGSRPGDKRIAEVLGAKVRTVEKHRAILVDLHLIECTRRATSKGEAAVWRLLPPSEWRSAENHTPADEVDDLPEPEWLEDDEEDAPAAEATICGKAIDSRWWCEKSPGHRGSCSPTYHPRPAPACG